MPLARGSGKSRFCCVVEVYILPMVDVYVSMVENFHKSFTVRERQCAGDRIQEGLSRYGH